MTYLATVGFIFFIMLAGIGVERLYRRFAAKNPRLGPFRDTTKCGSCSAGSGCGKEACDIQDAPPMPPPRG